MSNSMLKEEEDELVAREYTLHLKALKGKNAQEREEVLLWVKNRRLHLLLDAMKDDDSPRTNGAQAILKIIANLRRK